MLWLTSSTKSSINLKTQVSQQDIALRRDDHWAPHHLPVDLMFWPTSRGVHASLFETTNSLISTTHMTHHMSGVIWVLSNCITIFLSFVSCIVCNFISVNLHSLTHTCILQKQLCPSWIQSRGNSRTCMSYMRTDTHTCYIHTSAAVLISCAKNIFPVYKHNDTEMKWHRFLS